MRKIDLNEKYAGCKYSNHHETEDQYDWDTNEELGVKTLREHLEYCLSLDNRCIDRNREYIKSILEGKTTEIEDNGILEFMESVTHCQTVNGWEDSWYDVTSITLKPNALVEQEKKEIEEQYQNAAHSTSSDADELPF